MVRNRLRMMLAALLLFTAAPLMALAKQPASIADTQAAEHVGEMVVVDGIVESVYVSKKGNEFLNFGQPYPNQTFSGTSLHPLSPNSAT